VVAGVLRNPRNYDEETAMPHYRFNDSQVATLSGFLLPRLIPICWPMSISKLRLRSRSLTASAWFSD